MEVLDPRLGLLAAGAAIIGSERVRRTVGKGIGYTAAGAKKIGGPVARPLADAGRDIVEEAREVAGHDGTRKTRSSRAKSSSSS
jgi:hypothetical protein